MEYFILKNLQINRRQKSHLQSCSTKLTIDNNKSEKKKTANRNFVKKILPFLRVWIILCYNNHCLLTIFFL